MTAKRFQRYSNGELVKEQPSVIRPGVNAIIFNANGEVLLEKRSDNGFWGLPGGGVDIGESVAQAVKREVLEETGLQVSVKRLIGVYSDPHYYTFARYPNGDVVHYVALCFECDVQSGELQISDESLDIAYFAPDALPKDTLLSHSIRVEDATAHRQEPFIR